MSNPRLPTFKLRQIIQFESSELSALTLRNKIDVGAGVF